MQKQTIRIATRKSPLALWQANFVGQLIQSHWPEITFELIPLITSGDRFTKDRLQAMGGKGLFVKELEEALLDNRADIAVHSMKDVPALLPDGLSMIALCKRDNPFDMLITSDLAMTIHNLPKGSRIGTASLRRQSQLLAHRPDLDIHPLRGNINTRLNKLAENEFDAIVLAAAGLERMAINQPSQQLVPMDIMLPACGQGALGIEGRTEDNVIRQLLAPLNDLMTAQCVNVEREVNAQLGGNCHVPLAVFCQPKSPNQLDLRARVLTPDGTKMINDHQTGTFSDAMQLADHCVSNLLAKGAAELLKLS